MQPRPVNAREENTIILGSRYICMCLVVLPAFSVAVLEAQQDTSNAKHRLAINFNEAMNRCLQSGCPNIEEVVGFFADDATYLDDGAQIWSGKTAIRRRLSRPTAESGVADRIEAIDVADAMITLRLERRRTFKSGQYDVAEVKPHLQVLVVKGGRISRLISVIPPEEKQ